MGWVGRVTKIMLYWPFPCSLTPPWTPPSWWRRASRPRCSWPPRPATSPPRPWRATTPQLPGAWRGPTLPYPALQPSVGSLQPLSPPQQVRMNKHGNISILNAIQTQTGNILAIETKSPPTPTMVHNVGHHV